MEIIIGLASLFVLAVLCPLFIVRAMVATHKKTGEARKNWIAASVCLVLPIVFLFAAYFGANLAAGVAS